MTVLLQPVVAQQKSGSATTPGVVQNIAK